MCTQFMSYVLVVSCLNYLELAVRSIMNAEIKSTDFRGEDPELNLYQASLPHTGYVTATTNSDR